MTAPSPCLKTWTDRLGEHDEGKHLCGRDRDHHQKTCQCPCGTHTKYARRTERTTR